MRGFRLNGWQRIGIVLSLLWGVALGGAMKRVVICLAMVLALYNTAEAWTVYGDGRQSCASWTKAQEHRPQVEADGTFRVKLSDWQLMTQTSWVDGFISAFNYYVRQSGDVAKGIDTNGIFARIDTYCASHPLDNVAVATFALIEELKQRH